MNVGTGRERGHAVSFLGIHKSGFWYSVIYFKDFQMEKIALQST
jgi:hypothetical protein